MPGILDLADQSEHSTSNGASDAGMHTHSFGIKQIDPMHENNLVIGPDDPILLTGSNGFRFQSGRHFTPVRFLQYPLLCMTMGPAWSGPGNLADVPYRITLCTLFGLLTSISDSPVVIS
jgi:hypothetical protein